jgi:hypothetical protein
MTTIVRSTDHARSDGRRSVTTQLRLLERAIRGWRSGALDTHSRTSRPFNAVEATTPAVREWPRIANELPVS